MRLLLELTRNSTIHHS